jgi:DNA-binding beta-propeller fold protein YncE
VAVTADEVYVVDTGNERVQVFGIDGSFKRTWGGFGGEPGQLIEPVGIAIGPDGNVYVADSGNRRISIFTPRGEPVAQWPAEFWPLPNPDQVRPAFQPYLAFDEAGNLYVTSSGTGVVVVLDREGRPLETITEAGGDPLRQPLGIAVAPDGEVLITDIERDAVYRYPPPARFAQAPAQLAPVEDDTPAGTPAAATPVAAAPTTGPLPEPPGGRG